MVLVDTSTVIDIGRGKKTAAQTVEKAAAGGAPKVSAITLFELASSPRGFDEKTRRMLEAFAIVELSSEAAVEAGAAYRTLRSAGQDIGALDSLIAGTALCTNEPLATANARHFQRIPNLRVITY
ncbi:type II toxin-antitoxin system VapC family toxin [Candidatus Micrarchaeota archaeon]|nr:type II toxin-antitoxin system VapC family toxin [Candidatus Micrarchaeota archaeon]